MRTSTGRKRKSREFCSLKKVDFELVTEKWHVKFRSLKNKASRKHPKEYSKARARYPSPDSF